VPGDAPLRAAWRSMMWPLDAWGLSRPSPGASGAAPSWTESWLEATRWWTEALAEGPRLWPEANARLLVELAGGLARAFRGRPVGVELFGRRIRGELDSLWLDRRDDHYAGRLELRSVDCHGLEVDALSVVADAVALTSPPRVALMASGVEVQGRSALEPLVAWLDRELPEWNLRVAEGALIRAVPRSGGKRFLVDAAICDDELEVELRALQWGRVTLRCPYWLRLTRKMRLPALPEGVSVAEARHRGSSVEFRLSMPTLSHSFDPGRLRDAIAATRGPQRSSAPVSQRDRQRLDPGSPA
jgi:hypothetical protein